MEPQDIDRLLARLTTPRGFAVAGRRVLRRGQGWGLERVRLADPDTVLLTSVFKYAERPAAQEHHVLRTAAAAGIAVPRVLGAVQDGQLLGMMLTDLGRRTAPGTVPDAVAAAARIHQAPQPLGLPHIDHAALRALPRQLTVLLEVFDWSGPALELARALDRCALERTEDAQFEPMVLCHGSLAPDRVHIGRSATSIVDFSRAFLGPGLLDLARLAPAACSQEPDTAALGELIEEYVRAGGDRRALRERRGLSAARWAMGWLAVLDAHRRVSALSRDWNRVSEPASSTEVTSLLAAAAQLLKA